jgi:MSHA type pilus biogenesis protein MshL
MNKTIRQIGQLGALLVFLTSCASTQPPPAQHPARGGDLYAPLPATSSEGASQGEDTQLPVRFQRPNYLLSETAADKPNKVERENFVIPVGADLSSTVGPVPLRDIMRRLANIKNMNVSWASDVDQYLLVDVDIRAEDDFFRSIDNLLRQVDYFHEVQGHTIIVKYKETRRFHIGMPFLVTTYETGVGGDVLGGAKNLSDDAIKGNIKLYSEKNTFDLWTNIRTNLDQILDIWSEQASSPPPAKENDQADKDKDTPPPVVRKPSSSKGYYNIDQPIGMVTVTAPRPLLEKVESYLENLKKQLYRQISIEAKILEVSLEEGSTKGINWADVISNVHIDFQLFGPQGILYPGNNRFISQISTPDNPFTIILDAIEQQGRTKVLANPRLSVMNGQPALISVGENVRFISDIQSSVDRDSGVVTYTTSTASVLSGLGLSVVATILENDEIILSLTPVTSQLEEPIQAVQIGQGVIMLPKIRLREMNTLVRIKNGGMLVVGGLIDQTDQTRNTKVPILGDIPLFKRLFKSESKYEKKTELIILLRPQLI